MLRRFPWQLAVALAALFAAVRVVGVLGPLSLRWVLPLGFTLMALTPFLFLDRTARRDMGFAWPASGGAYLTAVAAGGAAAFACYLIGVGLFGTGVDNWFATIGANYRQVADTAGWPMLRLHLFFTIPALIFSPIGEEIFFRGLLQHALEQRFSAPAATLAECAAFGLIHLCHHGLLLTAAGFSVRPVSGAMWVLLMFGAAMMFAWLRKRSGSLLPAIAAHAMFNLVMNATIFAFLWPE